MTLPSGSVIEVGSPRSSRVQVVVAGPVLPAPPPFPRCAAADTWAADRDGGTPARSRSCPLTQLPLRPPVLAAPDRQRPGRRHRVGSVAVPEAPPFTYRVIAPVDALEVPTRCVQVPVGRRRSTRPGGGRAGRVGCGRAIPVPARGVVLEVERAGRPASCPTTVWELPRSRRPGPPTRPPKTRPWCDHGPAVANELPACQRTSPEPVPGHARGGCRAPRRPIWSAAAVPGGWVRATTPPGRPRRGR